MLTISADIYQKINSVANQIGHTPIIAIQGYHNNDKVKVFAKLEWKQLSGSVKARAAFNIIKEAIVEGRLHEHKTLLDATSGNTGIAYATIGKQLGINVSLVLPKNASKERKEILHSLGANIIYSSEFGGTDEAQAKAALLAKQYPDTYFYANQYANANNWLAHYNGTALEIIEEQPNITHFVAGIGTSGTIMGTTKRLKQYNPSITTIGLQPDFALHGLEGWKHLETAVIPKIYDSKLINNFLEINTQDAYDLIGAFYKSHQLLLSPSAAANLYGAIQVANSIEEGNVVTILADNADKYSEVIHKIL